MTTKIWNLIIYLFIEVNTSKYLLIQSLLQESKFLLTILIKNINGKYVALNRARLYVCVSMIFTTGVKFTKYV